MTAPDTRSDGPASTGTVLASPTGSPAAAPPGPPGPPGPLEPLTMLLQPCGSDETSGVGCELIETGAMVTFDIAPLLAPMDASQRSWYFHGLRTEDPSTLDELVAMAIDAGLLAPIEEIVPDGEYEVCPEFWVTDQARDAGLGSDVGSTAEGGDDLDGWNERHPPRPAATPVVAAVVAAVVGPLGRPADLDDLAEAAATELTAQLTAEPTTQPTAQTEPVLTAELGTGQEPRPAPAPPLAPA